MALVKCKQYGQTCASFTDVSREITGGDWREKKS